MGHIEVIPRSAVEAEPDYTGCTTDAGAGVTACPTSSHEEDSMILAVYFMDKQGQVIDQITYEDEVDLVVETVNLEREVLIIDVSGTGGDLTYMDQPIGMDSVLKLTVGSSEERIPLGVVPAWIEPDRSLLDPTDPEDTGSLDMSMPLEVVEVKGPDNEAIEADCTYAFAVASFNRPPLPEELSLVKWKYMVPGARKIRCVGPEFTLSDGNPAILLSWGADFSGSEVLVMPYVDYAGSPGGEPSEEVACRVTINTTPAGNSRMPLVNRHGWKARPPKIGPGLKYDIYPAALRNSLDTIVVHHIGDDISSDDDHPKTIGDVQKKHMEYDDMAKRMADIGYHFAIDLSAGIFEGRSLNVAGSHVKDRNTGAIGILLMGDFATSDDFEFTEPRKTWSTIIDPKDDVLSDDMLLALIRLIRWLKNRFPGIEHLGGHREVNLNHTVCPGSLVMERMDQLRSITKLKPPIGSQPT